MVTSSVPGEGKSTFTCSLATLVARSNPAAKILVVDCDLRRASVRNLLNVPATEGTLDRYLSKSKPLEGILGRVKGSGLFYVLARENTANSAELLGSRDMRSLMGALSKQFDLVLLDTPPLMAVPDSRVVAQLSDYIVFLVRWEQTERTLAMNALKLLSDVPTDIGVVLSQVDIKRHARYGFNDHGHYYAKYHDYYLS